MELLKKLFKNDDRVIGLCGFRKDEPENLRIYVPQFNPAKQIYGGNYKNNFLLL